MAVMKEDVLESELGLELSNHTLACLTIMLQ